MVGRQQLESIPRFTTVAFFIKQTMTVYTIVNTKDFNQYLIVENGRVQANVWKRHIFLTLREAEAKRNEILFWVTENGFYPEIKKDYI